MRYIRSVVSGMKRLLLKSMILKATVIRADVNYVGSITIDEELIERAGLHENESVLVVDRSSGNRLRTYVIVGERGSGMIGMNGASAHLITEGNVVDIMAFTWASGEIHPICVAVDRRNRFSHYVTEGAS
jgi:aspartate 1-decarboxylase